MAGSGAAHALDDSKVVVNTVDGSMVASSASSRSGMSDGDAGSGDDVSSDGCRNSDLSKGESRVVARPGGAGGSAGDRNGESTGSGEISNGADSGGLCVGGVRRDDPESVSSAWLGSAGFGASSSGDVDSAVEGCIGTPLRRVTGFGW